MKQFFVTLLLLLLPVFASADDISPCVGHKVSEIRIVGLVTPEIRTEAFKKQLTGMLDIQLGVEITGYRLQVARHRLMNTGLFFKVDFKCSAQQLIIRARENYRVKSIKFHGNRRIYTYQILTKLFVGKGDVLNPGTNDGQSVLQGIKDQIIGLYSEEGYFGTKVKVDWWTFQAQVMLDIRIQEGIRFRIGNISFNAPAIPAVSSGQPHCAVLKRSLVLNYAHIRRRQVFIRDYIKKKKELILRYLRTFGFVHPKVDMSFDKNRRVLSIGISYDKCWAVTVMTHWEGDEWMPAKKIAFYNALPFGNSGIYNMEEAESGIQGIRDYLEEYGYFFSRIKLYFRELYNEKPRQGSPVGIILYSVEPGIRLEIRRIVFNGNKSVKSKTLKKLMQTKVYDFFGSPGVMIVENVFADLERIRQYYINHGFYAFHFTDARNTDRIRLSKMRDGAGTIYRFIFRNMAFRLRTWPKDDGAYLEIGMKEGPQRNVNKISVSGNKCLSSLTVKSLLDMGKGKSFSPALLQKGILHIKQALFTKGHANARVSCDCSTPKGREIPCDNLPDGQDSVNLAVDIQEGPVTRVGSILIYGNKKTRNKVILRDMPKPGQVFNRAELSGAIGNLKDLGIFTNIDTITIGPDEKPPAKTATIVVHAKEAKTRFLDISLGFESMNRNEDFPKVVSNNLSTEISSSDNFWGYSGHSLGLNIPDILITAQVRYSDLNLAGTSYRLYIPVKYGFSMTAWDRYAVVAPSFVDPYFFLPGMTLRVTPFGVYDRATGNLDIIRLGNEIAISKELGHKFYSSLSYEISTVKTRVPDSGLPYLPWILENKVMPTLSYNGLDQPINPHNGIYASAVLSYISALVSNDFQNFLKFETTLKYFWSIRNFVTFGFMAHYGDSKPLDTNNLPQDERFTLGGNKGVRGYSDDGIAQYNSDGSLRLIKDSNGKYSKPFGGDTVLNGSVEIRFPIVRNINLYGAGFMDFGGLAESLKSFNRKTIRVSLGFGLRYILAGQLPIRLDYGIIMDRRCKYADPESGECIQREEFGNIQFGILYSF